MSLDLLGVFGAGLFTFVTPCVLPLVPIYLGALLGGDLRQASTVERGQLLFRALLFSLGFVSVFVALGLAASAIGGLLIDHRPALQAGGAMLVGLFGLKFLGVVQIPAFDRIVRAGESRSNNRMTALGALVMGVVFAAGWSPCVGPVLGTVLTYTASTTSSPWTGAGYLGLYGLGFALPLLVTAAFAEAGVRLLKRVNPWLPRIEKTLGLVLVVVAFSMMGDALPATAQGGPVATAESAKSGEALAAAPEGAPAAGLAAAEAQAELDARPKMIELYSQDCSICTRMMPIVAELQEECDSGSVGVEKIDVSLPENRHLVAQHRVVGVPTFLFVDADGQEVARLVGQQSKQALHQAVSALRGGACRGIGPVPGEEPEGGEAPAPGTACDLEALADPEGGFCEPGVL